VPAGAARRRIGRCASPRLWVPRPFDRGVRALWLFALGRHVRTPSFVWLNGTRKATWLQIPVVQFLPSVSDREAAPHQPRCAGLAPTGAATLAPKHERPLDLVGSLSRDTTRERRVPNAPSPIAPCHDLGRWESEPRSTARRQANHRSASPKEAPALPCDLAKWSALTSELSRAVRRRAARRNMSRGASRPGGA